MFGPLTIITRPRTTAETVAEIRTMIAAVDALLNGLSLDCNIAAAYIEDAQAALTEALGNVETALRYEGEYQDERDNRRVNPWLSSERYP